MSLTFLGFQVNHSELVDRATGERTDLGKAIGVLTARAVEIGVGLYVFETQRNYAELHDLRDTLRAYNRTFCEFEFEDELCGCFPPTTAERLEKFGLRLLNIWKA